MSATTERLILWLIPIAPLVAAVATAALGPKLLRERSHWPCWIGLAVSTICSLLLLFAIGPRHFQEHTTPIATGFQWLEVGGMNVAVTLRADAMTSIMLAMVTFVSFLVSVFAAGYMHGDGGYARFFAAVSLFVFSMCMLVLAANFLLLFVFWEGVGLCSYLLIGFWYRKPSAAAAAVKAFVVNRIGDFGFLLGIFLIWTTFGSLDYSEVLDKPARLAELSSAQPGLITAICLLLLLGAMGKSAQFPLHVWLPDAMEGPTPVSALIHAATMVTAGVYMVARATPLFVHAPTALLVVSAIGAVTALLSALIALTQFDLKRVLAYSTVSQLGYMFMALGAGAAGPELAAFATTAAMFHLFTHAFFKALLFLAAGSVMHSMGDVIDMRRFSGLKRSLPVTRWTFLFGAAALAGVPPLAGFWSKDDILAALHTAADSDHRTFFLVIFGVAAFTALLTAFYTFRAYFMTFHGEERFPKEAGPHPHDAPAVMALPLIALAACAALIGLAVGPTHWFASYLHHTSGLGEGHEHGLHYGLMAASAVIALAGVGLAWLLYVRVPELPARIAAALGPLYRLSLNKFYLDEIYRAVLVTPLVSLATFSHWIDRTIIDPTVDLVGRIPQGLSLAPRTVHNGLVPSYALVMWTGLVLCVLFALGVLT